MSLSPTLSGITVNNSRIVLSALSDDERRWTSSPADATDWQKPLSDYQDLTIEELKLREQQLHVDHVYDMVPFWMRGMEAAEKGEVLKLEDFLESLHDMSRTDDWDLRGCSGWEGPHSIREGWGLHTDCTSPEAEQAVKWSDMSPNPASGWCVPQAKRTFAHDGTHKHHTKHRRVGGSKNLPGKSLHALIDYVATEQDMDEDYRHKRYSFSKMSAEDQMKKIEELITGLRSNNASEEVD